MHPKLPVIWILKSSAVNQTVLKLSSIHEFWCLVLLSAAQHCALQACSVWWRGACASLSTDNSLSTTARLSLRVNLLSSSTQPNPELLVRIWASRAILQVLSAGEPVPSAGLSAPLSYSLFPSFQWHWEVLQRRQECSVWFCSLWSSAALPLTVCFAWPLLTVHQCNFHRNMVKWWLENMRGNADFFLFIIHSWSWNSLPFLVLHILFSQKTAKTDIWY